MRLQHRLANGIVSGLELVNSSIGFHDQLSLQADVISDVLANEVLAFELEAIEFPIPKFIP
ncbi:MAG TPA: hypothetical protein VHU18_13050 [Rhizomicrobium sp.]|nr:hypothetical protein [Rhizomicrobium sp.]